MFCKSSKDIVIHPGVLLGKNVIIGRFTVLGHPGRMAKTRKLEIGDNAVIRSHTVLYCGNKIGHSFQTGHHVLIRENNRIGDNVSIGSFSDIGRENIIEDNVRLHSRCFVPEFVVIKKGAWLGPGVTILNVLHPPCPKFELCAKSVVIGENAKIGGGAIIGPRVKIGREAFIGMGAVVTSSVPARTVVYGNPAKRIKSLDELKCQLKFFNRPYEWEKI